MQVSAPELKNTCRSDVTKHGTNQPLHMGPDNIENKKPAKKSLSFVDPTDNSREDISKKCEMSSQTLPGQGEIELFQFDFFKNFLFVPATLQFHRIS